MQSANTSLETASSIRTRIQAAVRPFCLVFCILCFGFFLTGCYERKQTGILNPDGSGKVVVETLVAVPAVQPGMATRPSAAALGRELASEFITSTQGVEAWSDVSVTETPDGRARILATAFFADVSRLKFDLPIGVEWKKQPNGDYTFTLARPRATTAPASAPATAAKPFTEADMTPSLRQMVSEAQADYKNTRDRLMLPLNAFTMEISFVLPGTVKDARILKSEGRVVSVVLDGKKIAPALDKFMGDSVALAASLKTGHDGTENDDYFMEALYGLKGPATATVTDVSDKPQFDYKTEMRAAQSNQSAMLQAAGIVLPKFTVKPATEPAK